MKGRRVTQDRSTPGFVCCFEFDLVPKYKTAHRLASMSGTEIMMYSFLANQLQLYDSDVFRWEWESEQTNWQVQWNGLFIAGQDGKKEETCDITMAFNHTHGEWYASVSAPDDPDCVGRDAKLTLPLGTPDTDRYRS